MTKKENMNETELRERDRRLTKLREMLEDKTLHAVLELLDKPDQVEILEELKSLEETYQELPIADSWDLYPYWQRDERLRLVEMSIDEIAMEIERHEKRQYHLKTVLNTKVKEARVKSSVAQEMLEKAEKRLPPDELEEWQEKSENYARIVTALNRTKPKAKKAKGITKVKKIKSLKEKYFDLVNLGLSEDDARTHSGWKGQ